MGWDRGWAPYVSVAQRRAQALREVAKLDKKSGKSGKARSPVRIVGRKMATTFWGEAWCDNLESYSDYSNRLPRGRTYARNGSILDLQIEQGNITALVSGSSLYKIKIQIKTLAPKLWKSIKTDCATSIHSMMDLLRGKLSTEVLQRLTQPKTGLFPQPNEIDLQCSCPDSAYLCKHLAAVMFGIGNRLDYSPEMFFVLRGVEQNELIGEVIGSQQLQSALSADPNSELAGDDLGSLFGIDLVSSPTSKESTQPKKRSTKKAERTIIQRSKTSTSKTLPKPTAKARTASKVQAIKQPLKKPSKRKTQTPTATNKENLATGVSKRKAVKNRTLQLESLTTQNEGLPVALRMMLEGEASRGKGNSKSKPR